MSKRRILTAWMLTWALLTVAGAAFAELSTNLRVETVRGNSNLVLTETYVDETGQPVIASDKGYATIRYSYGTGKVVTGIELLDENGNLVNGADGYARIDNRYSGKKQTEQRYYDKDGKLVYGPQGYARQETKGMWGDKQSTWEYDPEGNPVNLHRIIEYTRYGEYHLIVSDSWYDTEDRPAAGPEGYARLENDYVGAAKSRIAYYDEEGKPFYNPKAGYATLVREFTKSMETSLSYYGADGQRIKGPDGYSYAIYSYRNGGYKKSLFYNADGTLWYNSKGVCGIETLQNIRKQTVEEYYFTGENERGRSSDGYSGIQRAYNKYRIQTQEKYLDENDKPLVVEHLGYAKKLMVIRDKKLKVREEYYDEKGQLTLCTKGYSVIAQAFEHGQLMEIQYLDTDGKTLVNTADGYARITYERDENKNVIRTNWYDAEGKPCVGNSGAEEVRNTWDGKFKASESYWTAAGNPATGPDGVNQIQMEYNGAGKVTRKNLLDARNRPTEGKDGYASVETEYNSDGGTMSVRYYDKQRELMLAPGKEYAYERTVLLKDLSVIGTEGEEDEEVQEEEETEEDEPEEESTGEEPNEEDAGNTGGDMGAEDAGEDNDGAIGEGVMGSVVEYYGTDRQLMTLKAGYAIIQRKNDKAGKVTEESYYNADREPATLGAGYSKVEREYDAVGALSREAYFDAEGGKVTLAAGYHFYTCENDNKGNALKTAYFDAEGQPVINTSLLCHRVDKTYLDGKHVLTEAWFDTEGKPCATKDTYARIERTFDRNGNIQSEETFDTAGKPICRKDGYEENIRLYNEKKQLIETQYRTKGQLCDDINGVAVIQRKYDDQGNVAEEWYLNHEGIATESMKTHYHKVAREYLDAKHVKNERWYDPWGKPTTTGDTYAQIRREFDENGNMTRERTFGTDRKPIARKDGYDEARWTYDDENRIIKIEYLLDGAPALKNDGVAEIHREYDEQGLVAAESYYGTEGEPVLLSGNKYHRIERTWQDSKHATSEAWFDTNGMPITQGDTYVKIEREFDEKGNTLSETTCDETGKPIARKAGYDQVRNTFNEKNQVIRIEYLLDGAPVLKNDGVAEIRREYDEQGLVAAESYYGTEGEPVLLSGNKYHRIERTWQDSKHATSEAWFDTNGMPITQGDTYVKIEREFDEKGNTTEERYYGPDAAPVACKGGWDTLRRMFDENNRPARFFYLLNGEAYTVADGYAVMDREYDAAGNVSRERYYDGGRNPVRCKKGYGEIRKEYNEKKQVIRESWFDTDGTPIRLGDTYCSVEREYDDAGNVSVTRYQDEAGEPIACKAGYEMVWKRYNEKKQVIFESYLDHTGAPMKNSKGVYQTTYDYNDQGKIIQEQYFDAEGNLTRNTDGYERIIRTWNEDGSLASEEGK